MGYPKPWKIYIEAPCVGESIDIRGLIDPIRVTRRLNHFGYHYRDKVSVISKWCYEKKELWVEIDIRKEETDEESL